MNKSSDAKGSVRVCVPELLERRGETAKDLLYGARLAPGTAYRLAEGQAESISLEVLARLCGYFQVGVGEILKYDPPAE